MQLHAREKLRQYFSKRHDVALAYVFGSNARNGATNGADLDVAVLMDDAACGSPLAHETEIRHDLVDMLRMKNIDVVVLNTASLLLRHEVLCKSAPVFERDEESRVDFEATSESKYFDFLPVQQMFWNALVERVKEGRFGGSK